jgi:histidinol-phosphate aminotransferase
VKPIREMMLPHLASMQGYAGVDPLEVLAREAGIPPEKVVRLNGNENPYGPSPKAVQALGSYRYYNLYPDPDQRQIREALSRYLSVEPERLVAGNGSDEIIDLVLRLFVKPGDKVLVPTPTFGMYAFSTRVCGGEPVSVPRDEQFAVDVDGLVSASDSRARLAFITSPNNPTGNVTPARVVERLLALGLIVVVDETYYEFCGKTVLPLVREHPNLIVLRTFSKWAGLAGLRIGLGVMAPEAARVMMTVKPPYNVNLAAQVALLATLEDRELLLSRVKALVAERERMRRLLSDVPGVKVWPSQANFLLCQMPEGHGPRAYRGLARCGIFVRYFDTPRLKDCIRISVGLPEHTDALVSALRQTLKE